MVLNIEWLNTLVMGILKYLIYFKVDFQFNAQYDNLTFDKSLQDAGLRTLIIFHFNLITNMFVLISIFLKVGPCLSVLNTVV